MADPYNTITIYRNAGYQFPLLLENLAAYPQVLTGYGFAFLIAPSSSVNGAPFGSPVITNSHPLTTEPGLITFQLSPTDTASLVAGNAYNYVVMGQPPGQFPVVYQSGRAKVLDAPVMPTFTPVP